MNKITIFFISLLLLLTKINFSQTIIPEGEIAGTWTFANSPYIINGDITIPNDSTLIIEPGVKIEFQGHYGLNIEGALLAIGTEQDTIIFTINDTTGFYDPDTNLGGWAGIDIIDPDPTNDSTKISYCKLEYGKAVGSVWHLNAGGAVTILNFDKVLIAHSLFRNNSAGGDSTEVPTGGAIHLAWSNILFIGNTFLNNRAVSGGAIQFHESNPTFIENTFTKNYATNNGGAIAVGSKSSPTFSGDKFINNIANFNGGGIACWDSSITSLENVLISNNLSNDGGGIYSTSATLTLASCSFLNNGAKSIGGGINSFRSNIDFESCTFVEDTASVFGGGAGFYESEIKLKNSLFNNNTSKILGGGIHSDFSSITLTDCEFNSDTSESGGAIFAWYNNLEVDNCIFSDNSAKYNSGAIHSESGTTEIIGCSFTENRAIWGGAVGLYRDTSIISNSIFSKNISEHGGGINAGMSQLKILNVAFEQNKSIWGGGASIGNCEVEIDSCSFSQNIASNNAGGIEYFADTLLQASPYKLYLLNTIFEENSARFRGALEIQQNNIEESLVNVEIDNCQFLNNSAATGVNILISGKITDFTLSNSIIRGNNSILRTSGCNFNNYVSGAVTNCLFDANNTGGGSSVAAIGVGANVSFINCTIANNKGTNGAAITLRNSGVVQLFNSILWGNEPYNVILNAVSDPIGCKLDLYYSDIQNGIDSIIVNDSLSAINWGVGNFDQDPNFVDTANHDYSLSDESPCIDAGQGSIEVSGIWYYSPSLDILGNPRPNPEGSNSDMGAYENHNGTQVDISKEEDVIWKFALNQNYPNPFNPITTIKYSLSNQSYVTLKIFDILGNEVKTLVSKQQNIGNYRVNFDGNNYSSGVYFYKIQAGDFVETKKMILLR